MGNNNLGWVIILIIIVIIFICALIWWANSSRKDESARRDQVFLRKMDYRMLEYEHKLKRNFTSTNQNGNTRFETSRSFKLNKGDRYKIVLPKNENKYIIDLPKNVDKERNYTVSIKLDFLEHKISIQTPTSTPDGRMEDGYVAEIRHHIFEDSMLYDTLNDPVIQPSEINRSTQRGATKISIKKSQGNDLMIEFDISPGVMVTGSMTIRLDSLSPSHQMGNDFAIKNKSDYN